MIEIEQWRRAWRAMVPSLPTGGLIALRDAIHSNSRELVQNGTTVPPHWLGLQNWPVEAACPIGYCGWKGKDLKAVWEVAEFFFQCCSQCNQVLPNPDGHNWFIYWFDGTSRKEALSLLLPEVDLAIAGRMQS